MGSFRDELSVRRFYNKVEHHQSNTKRLLPGLGWAIRSSLFCLVKTFSNAICSNFLLGDRINAGPIGSSFEMWTAGAHGCQQLPSEREQLSEAVRLADTSATF